MVPDLPKSAGAQWREALKVLARGPSALRPDGVPEVQTFAAAIGDDFRAVVEVDSKRLAPQGRLTAGTHGFPTFWLGRPRCIHIDVGVDLSQIGPLL